MSAPTIAAEVNSSDDDDTSLSALKSSLEVDIAILSMEKDLLSFVSNMDTLQAQMSVHDTVLTIFGKIQEALAMLEEYRRRELISGVGPSVTMKIALKSIEFLTEQMMKRNEELLTNVAKANEDGNNNGKRHLQGQSSVNGNEQKRSKKASAPLPESVPVNSEDAAGDLSDFSSSDRDDQAAITCNNTRWQGRYQELVEYKKKHGHCNVPTKSGPLGGWVGRNRARYKGNKNEQKYPLTPEQIDLLNQIGFQWTIDRSTKREGGIVTTRTWDEHSGEKKVDGWDIFYQELVEFKKKHGHCNVPNKSGPLGNWVGKNRARYKGAPSYRTNPLTPDQIDLLNQLGFQWTVEKFGRDKDPWNTRQKWDAKYQELVEFKKKHGHCNVPGNSGGPLGSWVARNRARYKGGVPSETMSPLAPDQIDLLNQLGFQWTFDKTTSPADTKSQICDDRYQDLVELSASLGSWAAKRMLDNKPPLTR